MTKMRLGNDLCTSVTTVQNVMSTVQGSVLHAHLVIDLCRFLIEPQNIVLVDPEGDDDEKRDQRVVERHRSAKCEREEEVLEHHLVHNHARKKPKDTHFYP